MLTKGELDFQKKYGHASLCNCIRQYRGKIVVTVRRCTCGGWNKLKDNQKIQPTDSADGGECGLDCHYKEPYGFVHEADCPNG